jgi:hypothetical protein
MAWTPGKNTLNPRVMAENILTYCLDATRQDDAIKWANSNTSLRLVNRVAVIKLDPSLSPYPAVEFSDDNDEQEYGDDMIACVYVATFDFGVQSTTAAQAVTDARIYDKAWRSMIVNCPASTLAANTGAVVATAQVVNIQTGFLRIQAGNQGTATNDFLQAFEMKVMIALTGGSNN